MSKLRVLGGCGGCSLFYPETGRSGTCQHPNRSNFEGDVERDAQPPEWCPLPAVDLDAARAEGWTKGHAAGYSDGVVAGKLRMREAEGRATARDRELLGRRVREVWIEWAREQAAPKASWLIPWEDLSEPDREVDRRIGEALAAEGRAEAVRALRERARMAESTSSYATRNTLIDAADAIESGSATPKPPPAPTEVAEPTTRWVGKHPWSGRATAQAQASKKPRKGK